MTQSPGFQRRVFDCVAQVPAGRVATYGDIAARIGHPRAARQVGYAMARCPADLPWHRIINAQGMISDRGDVVRVEEQRHRLEAEGIAFDERGVCDLRALRFRFLTPTGEP